MTEQLNWTELNHNITNPDNFLPIKLMSYLFFIPKVLYCLPLTYLSSYPQPKSPSRACVLICFTHVWLCNPIGCTPPGFSVHGIFLGGILEWVAMPSFRGSSQSRDWTRVSCILGGFFATEPLGKPNPLHIQSQFQVSLPPISLFASCQCTVFFLLSWK